MENVIEIKNLNKKYEDFSLNEYSMVAEPPNP